MHFGHPVGTETAAVRNLIDYAKTGFLGIFVAETNLELLSKHNDSVNDHARDTYA